MNQEFRISTLKLIQDDEGFGIARLTDVEGTWQTIATFIYPEDAIAYFANTIVEALQIKQHNKQRKVENLPEISAENLEYFKKMLSQKSKE